MDTGLDASKISSKKVLYKTSGFIENKIADAVVKSNDDRNVKLKHAIDKNPRNTEEIIIPPEKR